MASRLLRGSLRHQAVVTATLLAGLLLNLLVIGVVDPPADLLERNVPMAAQCQGGGGPGCAEQPFIPPPSVGMPRFDAPPPPVFGALTLLVPQPEDDLHATPPRLSEHPPTSTPAV